MSNQLIELTFNVPCRKFQIALTVTRDDRLPMVREFCLRFLYVLKVASADELAAFFGFSNHQVCVLIEDLMEGDLVAMSGNELTLTTKSERMFESSAGKTARFVDAEEWNEHFAVDFISFRILKAGRVPQSVRRHITLDAADREKVATSKDIAERVFAESFYEYIDRYKTEIPADERSGYSIYGVHSIKGGSTFNYPLDVTFIVSDTNPLTITHDYPDFQSEAAQQDRKSLISAVADRVSGLVNISEFPSQIHSDVATILEDSLFADSLMSGNLDYAEICHLDPISEATFDGGYSVPFIGAMSLSSNQEIVLRMLRSRQSRNSYEQDKNPAATAVWVKPSNELALRNQNAFDFISLIRKEVTRIGSRPTNFYAFINSNFERGDSIEDEMKFLNNRPVFDGVILSNASAASKGIELLLVPGELVACSVYLQSPESEFPFIFGFASTDSNRITLVSELLSRWWGGHGRKVSGKSLNTNLDVEPSIKPHSLAKLLGLSGSSTSRRSALGRNILTLKKEQQR